MRAHDFGRALPAAHEVPRNAGGTRINVLLSTLAALEEGSERYHELAAQNLDRWASSVALTAEPSSLPAPAKCQVVVLPGDWGDVTLKMTKDFGRIFACLNMANAYCPGGGYVEGMIAQEENMFRRTDCHFSIKKEHMKSSNGLYLPEHSSMLNAEQGRVYLDVQHPRVCIRSSEDRSQHDLGYGWLPDDEVFPFLELRAAAPDLRDGSPYDHKEMLKRVDAQLETLHAAGIRHAVLSVRAHSTPIPACTSTLQRPHSCNALSVPPSASFAQAFGCGAFRNPAPRVAEAYKEALTARAHQFDVVAFAVFHAGYGPDNYTPFAQVFADW